MVDRVRALFVPEIQVREVPVRERGVPVHHFKPDAMPGLEHVGCRVHLDLKLVHLARGEWLRVRVGVERPVSRAPGLVLLPVGGLQPSLRYVHRRRLHARGAILLALWRLIGEPHDEIGVSLVGGCV